MLRRLPVPSLLICLVLISFNLRGETFQNPRHIPVQGGANNLGSADFNGDGLPDFYSLDSVTNLYINPHLNIELAQPGNTYSAPISVTLPVQTPICRAVDINNDHLADLICISGLPGTAPAIVNILLGNGNGTFQTPRTITFARNAQYAGYSMAFYTAGDTNGDGHTDFIINDGIGNQILTFLGDGSGNFPTYKSLTLPSNFAAGTTNAQLADVNHDGHPDLLLGGPVVLLGVGDGSFILPNPYPQNAAPLCAFADMDGDGQPDSICLVSTQTASPPYQYIDYLSILHGRPDGTFDPNPIAYIPLPNSDFIGPAFIADLNGDGIPDIIAHSNDGMSVFLGQPGLHFAPPVHYNFYNLGGLNPYQPDLSLFADFNGDGLLDVAAPGVNGIFITYGRANGTFDAGPIVQSGDSMGFAVVADFDGDGIPDVISSGLTSLFFDSGRGDGTFQPAVPVSTQTSTYTQAPDTFLLHGDFNGDGKPDLLVAPSPTNNNGYTGLLFNRGNAPFQAPINVSSSTPGVFIAINRTVAVADVNGDGRDDLLTATYVPSASTGSSVAFYAHLSNGDGTFKSVGTPVPLNSNGFAYYNSAPAVADLNGDGKLDVVLAANDTVQILLGHGDGSFTLGTPVPVPPVNGSPVTYIPAVVTGDFDRDGHQDFAVLATSSAYSSDDYDSGPTALIVFYGNGDGTFAPGIIAGVLDHGYLSLATADLNHDGLADFVMSTDTAYGTDFDLDAIAILHGQPNRTFSAETNLIGGRGLSSMAIADFNRDGQPDLLFTTAGFNLYGVGAGNNFTILLNQSGPYVQGTLTASPEPSTVGQPFTLTAALTPYVLTNLPTGTVSFTIDGVSVGTASLTNGSASLPITQAYARGTHSLGATWPGDLHYPGITLTGIHQITGLPVALTLTSSANPTSLGTSIQLTTSLANPPSSPGSTPPPAGTITVADNGSTFATLTASSAALYTGTASRVFATAGIHTLTATYSGDALHDPATATLAQTVTPLSSQTTLTSSPNPSTFGQSVTFTATSTVVSATPVVNPLAGATFMLSGLPGGPITVAAALSQTGPATASVASATYNTSLLPSGRYTVSAAFSGNTNAKASVSTPLTQIVSATATSVVLTNTPNPAYQRQAVSLSARLLGSPSPTGSIRFSDASSVLATVPLTSAATATFTTSTLSIGSHPITASYLGDNNDLPSTSPTVLETILPSDFTLSIDVPSVTLATGHHTTFALSTLSVGAFADSVVFSSSSLPLYATVEFHPASVDLTPGSSASSKVYLDTDAVLGFISRNQPVGAQPDLDPLPLSLAASFLFFLLPRQRRRARTLFTLLAAAILLSSSIGCANRYPRSVAPGRYTLHITGTGVHTGLTHTIDLPLTVTAH